MTPGEFEELVLTGVLPLGDAGEGVDTPPLHLEDAKPSGGFLRRLGEMAGRIVLLLRQV